MILGETLTLRHEVSAAAAFVISSPEIDVYDAGGTKVVDDAAASVDTSDPLAQILSYAFTPSSVGEYRAVFRCVIGGQTRFFEQGVTVKAVATATVQDYLRNLLDDEDPSNQYWSDSELAMYLARWRRSVVLPGLGTGNVTGLPSGAAFAATRGPHAGNPDDAFLTPSPDYKTFRAAEHLRFWASSPAPVVYVGGVKVTGDADWAYTVDALNGAVTFTTVDGTVGASVHPLLGVSAAFDHFPVYEIAFEALTVAMGQWASVQEVQTSSMRVRRATLRDAYQRVCRLRQMGQPKSIARSRPR